MLILIIPLSNVPFIFCLEFPVFSNILYLGGKLITGDLSRCRTEHASKDTNVRGPFLAHSATEATMIMYYILCYIDDSYGMIINIRPKKVYVAMSGWLWLVTTHGWHPNQGRSSFGSHGSTFYRIIRLPRNKKNIFGYNRIILENATVLF